MEASFSRDFRSLVLVIAAIVLASCTGSTPEAAPATFATPSPPVTAPRLATGPTTVPATPAGPAYPAPLFPQPSATPHGSPAQPTTIPTSPTPVAGLPPTPVPLPDAPQEATPVARPEDGLALLLSSQPEGAHLTWITLQGTSIPLPEIRAWSPVLSIDSRYLAYRQPLKAYRTAVVVTDWEERRAWRISPPDRWGSRPGPFAQPQVAGLLVIHRTPDGQQLLAQTLTLPEGNLHADPGALRVLRSGRELPARPDAWSSATSHRVISAYLPESDAPPMGLYGLDADDAIHRWSEKSYQGLPVLDRSGRHLTYLTYDPAFPLATVQPSGPGLLANVLRLLDLTTGEVRTPVHDPKGLAESWSLTWSPDGRWLVVPWGTAQTDGHWQLTELRRVRVEDVEVVPWIQLKPEEELWGVDWCRDGRLLYLTYSREREESTLWAARMGEQPRRLITLTGIHSLVGCVQ